jgi:hypothetical protein
MITSPYTVAKTEMKVWMLLIASRIGTRRPFAFARTFPTPG